MRDSDTLQENEFIFFFLTLDSQALADLHKIKGREG
jgi:hypothetical protein